MIPFNKPYHSENAMQYISEALASRTAGDGHFTRKCHDWLEINTTCKKALLTHSCTGALEMAAILTDIKPGDEIIMPSYTFTSTANAFVLRGGVPVFVDIREDTLNIDETLIEAAITPKTKAIVPVHYAGVACDMDAIMDIANRHHLTVIEDAAQSIMSKYQGKSLGSFGHLACLSFHETKNIGAGEGGALLINDENLITRAEIIREKGTNRSQFIQGQVDKYTWVDIGSSFLPSEITAAYLLSQLEIAANITEKRLHIWQQYYDALTKANLDYTLPFLPDDCHHNAHMFYLILDNRKQRDALISHLDKHHIKSSFHYIPLHLSPAGMRYGKAHGELPVSCKVADTILRLPLFPDMGDEMTLKIVEHIVDFF